MPTFLAALTLKITRHKRYVYNMGHKTWDFGLGIWDKTISNNHMHANWNVISGNHGKSILLFKINKEELLCECFYKIA